MTNTEHDRRIDYIEFSVKSVTDAKRFYGGAFGWTFVVIYAANLEAMERRVKEAGGKIVRPIFSFPGGRRFHFTDPSGNELAVWSDKE
jgi:predicted enzyme related to lactoylglutathione lyase